MRSAAANPLGEKSPRKNDKRRGGGNSWKVMLSATAIATVFTSGWMFHMNSVFLLSDTASVFAPGGDVQHLSPASMATNPEHRANPRRRGWTGRTRDGNSRVASVADDGKKQPTSTTARGKLGVQPRRYGIEKRPRIPFDSDIEDAVEKQELVEKKIRLLVQNNPECVDKEPYLRILFSASDNRYRRYDRQPEAKRVCAILPNITEVARVHGPDVIVHGMETCAAYRQLLTAENNNGKSVLPKPRVSGLYHTGTNALSRSFDSNIRQLAKRTPAFSPYEVPVRNS